MYDSDSKLPKLIVLGNQEEATRMMTGFIRGKLRHRQMGAILDKADNTKQVETLVERIVELLIETAENNSYDDWYDNDQKVRFKLSKKEFTDWAKSGRQSAHRLAMGYFRFIHAEASGGEI